MSRDCKINSEQSPHDVTHRFLKSHCEAHSEVAVVIVILAAPDSANSHLGETEWSLKEPNEAATLWIAICDETRLSLKVCTALIMHNFKPSCNLNQRII